MEAIDVSNFNLSNINFVENSFLTTTRDKMPPLSEDNITHVKTLCKLWLPLIISILVEKFYLIS
jgi:hypothetical protein